MDPFGFFFIAAGLLSVAAGTFGWEWFLSHRKARFFVSIFGRTGARIFYVIVGAGFVVFGVMFLPGYIKDNPRRKARFQHTNVPVLVYSECQLRGIEFNAASQGLRSRISCSRWKEA